ncbi:VCBS repeat-containing protein [Flavihumibacter fluvii]|uniref:VCBS repeat-containing protein n=1 Tax=Flavihumibacter fluvii TaxID=2838157 RepID=UPI001BDF0FC1|nr:VCBS repeat-containing protein [Flavihumibacter fluvii]ULQ51420.1 VCBS repeat-containing protein [Flavihumibacter fluvii]
MKKNWILLFLPAFLINSCSNKTNTLFTELDKDDTNIDFRNLVVEDESLNISQYIYFYNGAGVAVGDINNDGLEDIFFAGNMVKNRLFLNKGNFKFENITVQSHVAEKQGWCTGTSMVDINQDGFLDIYICRSADQDPEKRKNLLYVNNGDLTFTEEGEKYGLADNGFSTHAAFFDFDKDGDLDCFVLNHSVAKYSVGVAENPELRKERNHDYEDRLYRNDNGHFQDISEQAGIVSNALNFGLGVVVSDFNNDGWPDMYVSNDFDESDYFYINNKNGTFSESFSKCMQVSSLNTMGLDAADFNNDGLSDIVTLDMLPETNYLQKTHAGSNNFDKTNFLISKGFQPQFSQNTLQKNNGDGTFSEIAQLAGISNTDWSWSALFCDFDGDTNKDLFVGNGFVKDFSDHDFINFSADKLARAKKDGAGVPIKKILEEMPTLKISNYIFRNNGNGTFANNTSEWGLNKPILSYGAAYADLDNDGDMDLVLNNTDDYASIYKNNSRTTLKNNYIQFKLEGATPNRNGIGTKLKIYSKGQIFYQEQFPVRGYQSSVDLRLNFGLGQINKIDSLVVVWPNDKYEVITDLALNQLHILKQVDATGNYNYVLPPQPALMTTSVIGNIKHSENAFNDFTVQRLLPNYLSREGPAVSVADINKDGMNDIFFGNGRGHASKLFYQVSDGNFKPAPIPVLQKDSSAEVTASVFFDADQDGDMDLYIGHGGYEFEERDSAFQDRLFINDGKVGFTERNLPPLLFSKGCIQPGDIDGDGDLDLFVGGRLVPGKYPLPAPSRILINDGKGFFSDVTNSIAPSFDTLGMVTAAAWIDLNNDQKKELVIAGEWMPIKVYSLVNGKLSDVSANYIHFGSSGWWNRISVADMDNDGDEDLIVGNTGTNTQFHVTEKEPISIVYNDFDKNGSIDPILFYYIQGINYPAFSRDEMSDQLPGIKKTFLTYKSYASAKMDDLFTKEQLSESHTIKAELMETIYLENKGNDLALHKLPLEAQYAPVYGIVTADFNGDEIKDILLVGSNTWTRVRFGRYTANHGTILLGDKSGNFKYVPQTTSGLKLEGNIRAASLIDERNIFLGVNDGNALLLKIGK